jgi:hypothetical protein
MLADSATLPISFLWFIRIAVPFAAVLISAGFFFSVLPPTATQTNGAVSLIYLGAVVLAVTVVSLGWFDQSCVIRPSKGEHMKATRETKTSHYRRNFLLAFLLFLVAYIGAGVAQTDSGCSLQSSTVASMFRFSSTHRTHQRESSNAYTSGDHGRQASWLPFLTLR